MEDLKLCQICSEPAQYGDGLTWARCAKHQYEYDKEHQTIEAKEEKLLPQDGFPHETIEGLTSIIIPIYNISYSLFHLTGNCIGSIKEHTDLPYEIILVDNGSSIKPADLNQYNVDKVIVNEQNLGYVKAVNKGIRASFGEYIAILTNDIQVYDHWLFDALEALTKVDLVYAAPMYGEPYSRAVEANIKRQKWADKPIEESLNNNLEDGSCLVARKSLFDEIGLLDEGYFNYAADRDLFKRLDEVSKKHARCERINIHHIIQATGSGVDQNAEQMNKDKEYYKQKWENQGSQ